MPVIVMSSLPRALLRRVARPAQAVAAPLHRRFDLISKRGHLTELVVDHPDLSLPTVRPSAQQPRHRYRKGTAAGGGGGEGGAWGGHPHLLLRGLSPCPFVELRGHLGH